MEENPDKLGSKLKKIENDLLNLKLITNRGVMVYPDGMPETFCSDHWRCRYIAKKEGDVITHESILDQLASIQGAGLDSIKTENLYTFDGVKGYSLGQGE